MDLRFIKCSTQVRYYTRCLFLRHANMNKLSSSAFLGREKMSLAHSVFSAKDVSWKRLSANYYAFLTSGLCHFLLHSPIALNASTKSFPLAVRVYCVYGGELPSMVFSTILFSESLASFMDRVLELIGFNSRINSLNLLGLFPKASWPIIRRLHLSPMIAIVFAIISIFCPLLRPSTTCFPFSYLLYLWLAQT